MPEINTHYDPNLVVMIIVFYQQRLIDCVREPLSEELR